MVNRSNTPQQWWQWVLMYPTLFVALLGSLPTVSNIANAIRFQVPFLEVQIAVEQHKLWKKNWACTQEKPIHWLESKKEGLQVGVTICPNNDILVAFGQPLSEHRWIGFETFNHNQPILSGLIPKAIATELTPRLNLTQTQENTQVLCQKKLSDTRILRRVKMADGKCFNLIINTATGAVVKKEAVQCNSDCD